MGCNQEDFAAVATCGAAAAKLGPFDALIANAGILVSEVVLVARKSRTAVERVATATAGRDRPRDPRPPAGVEFPLPHATRLDVREVTLFRTLARNVGVIGRASGDAPRGTCLEPRAHFSPEFLLLGGLVEVHDQPAKKE